jgi:hypothetical protein
MSYLASSPTTLSTPRFYCPANCAGRGVCRHGVVNGCECFDPNDASPHCANSPIRPPTPAPTTAEDDEIGSGATAEAAGLGALPDEIIADDTPAAAPPANASSGGGTSPDSSSFEGSLEDDPEEETPTPEADDAGQDTVTIVIGGSPTTPTSATADAAPSFIFLESSVTPDNHGSLDGVERGPTVTSSSTANAVPLKWLFTLMQSSLLVISWI